jgi:L-ribulose-5-phosphate 3-epimerase
MAGRPWERMPHTRGQRPGFLGDFLGFRVSGLGVSLGFVLERPDGGLRIFFSPRADGSGKLSYMNRHAFSIPLPRREFLRLGAATLAAPAFLHLGAARANAAETVTSLKGRLYRSLKIGMVTAPGSLTDKFKLLKEVGFDGVEMDSPGLNVAETQAAIAESGLPVDGTVCSTHWGVRHSDKDPAVRAKALADLQKAIRDTHAIGGNSVLLVVGHGKDGTEREVWDRSVANIRLALPLAAQLGVYIAVENVWNQFLYQHDGPENQTANKLRDYIDEFNSPWVGAHFDLGNHQKYGKPAEWLRTLGKRVVKLDVKDWGKKAGWPKIGQGDVDWPAVRQALLDIGYAGWGAAEVSGGGRDQLREVREQMDQVFALS